MKKNITQRKLKQEGGLESPFNENTNDNEADLKFSQFLEPPKMSVLASMQNGMGIASLSAEVRRYEKIICSKNYIVGLNSREHNAGFKRICSNTNHRRNQL